MKNLDRPGGRFHSYRRRGRVRGCCEPRDRASGAMGILEKIKDIELEMSRTQKNKATEGHLGILKSKLAKLRTELLAPSKSGGGEGDGFEVSKYGHGRVALIGFRRRASPRCSPSSPAPTPRRRTSSPRSPDPGRDPLQRREDPVAGSPRDHRGRERGQGARRAGYRGRQVVRPHPDGPRRDQVGGGHLATHKEILTRGSRRWACA